MQALDPVIRENLSFIVLGLAGMTLVLGAGLVIQSRRLNQVRRKWQMLLDEANGGNLERMLYDHLKERMKIESDLEAARTRLKALEEIATTGKRFMGVVRYDAFPDVGGQQSFAMALFDDRGEGFILSSIVGRSDCRVFCKALSGGKAQRELTKEEQEALDLASRSNLKKVLVSSS